MILLPAVFQKGDHAADTLARCINQACWAVFGAAEAGARPASNIHTEHALQPRRSPPDVQARQQVHTYWLGRLLRRRCHCVHTVQNVQQRPVNPLRMRSSVVAHPFLSPDTRFLFASRCDRHPLSADPPQRTSRRRVGKRSPARDEAEKHPAPVIMQHGPIMGPWCPSVGVAPQGPPPAPLQTGRPGHVSIYTHAWLRPVTPPPEGQPRSAAANPTPRLVLAGTNHSGRGNALGGWGAGGRRGRDARPRRVGM